MLCVHSRHTTSPIITLFFKLPLVNQGESQTIYLPVTSGSSMTLSFFLWSPETFAEVKIGDMLPVGLFYGSLLIILGYHLFLFISLKDRIYFYFILFLTSSILFFATYEGIADQFLWPGLSEEKLYFIVISMALLFITSLKFGDVFLEQQIRARHLHRLSFYIFMGLWGLMIAIVPFASYGFMAQLTSILFFITPVLIMLRGF